MPVDFMLRSLDSTRMTSAADLVFDELYGRVVTLDLPPGSRLSEADVARRMRACSRRATRSIGCPSWASCRSGRSSRRRLRGRSARCRAKNAPGRCSGTTRRTWTGLCYLSLPFAAESALSEHERTLDAFRARDAGLAAEWMRRHLAAIEGIIAEMRTDHGEYFEEPAT